MSYPFKVGLDITIMVYSRIFFLFTESYLHNAEIIELLYSSFQCRDDSTFIRKNNSFYQFLTHHTLSCEREEERILQRRERITGQRTKDKGQRSKNENVKESKRINNKLRKLRDGVGKIF